MQNISQPPTFQEKPVFVSVDETVRLTGLGRTNVFDLIKEKKLKTVKKGPRRLVVRASINDLVQTLAES